MDATSWEERLGDLALPDRAVPLVARYLQLLEAASSRFNLVGDPPERWVARHVADALRPESLDGPLVDVGAGAGLPGLIFAILVPERPVTLVESVRKKAAFLSDVVAALELPNVVVCHARAEVIGREPDHRERYATATCRALARPATALELTLPLVRVGGTALYFLGADDAAGFGDLKATERLGGELERLDEYELTADTGLLYIARVAKRSPTPEAFPRRDGVPRKRPLA